MIDLKRLRMEWESREMAGGLATPKQETRGVLALLDYAEATEARATALESERNRAELHQKTATEAAHAQMERAEKAEAELPSLRAALAEETMKRTEMQKLANRFKSIRACQKDNDDLRAALATSRVETELANASVRAMHNPHRTLAMENAVLARDLATSRALAMAEAAQVAKAQQYFLDTNVGKRQEWVKLEIAEKILKLAHLPQGLVAVPRETLEKARRALEESNACACAETCDVDDEPERAFHTKTCRDACAALAALKLEEP